MNRVLHAQPVLIQQLNMNAVILLCAAVAGCLAMTTHTPHATREPSEHNNMFFVYNPNTHSMIVKINWRECIVSHLTPSEQLSVHTDDGIRAIEVRLIASMFTKIKVDRSTLHANDAKVCGHGHNNTMTYYTL